MGMNTRTVLLVEDDPEQALLFTVVLQRSGYTVEWVTDAALAQARLAVEPVALLLSDWELPGEMQGDDLIARVKARDPGLKTILSSCHPDVADAATRCGADATFCKFDGIIRLRQLVTRVAPPTADHVGYPLARSVR